jgi:hypothetical protein
MDEQTEERIKEIKRRLSVVGDVELSENRADAVAALIFSDIPWLVTQLERKYRLYQERRSQ